MRGLVTKKTTVNRVATLTNATRATATTALVTTDVTAKVMTKAAAVRRRGRRGETDEGGEYDSDYNSGDDRCDMKGYDDNNYGWRGNED